jgi:hypothetical protein
MPVLAAGAPPPVRFCQTRATAPPASLVESIAIGNPTAAAKPPANNIPRFGNNIILLRCNVAWESL